MFQRQFFPLNSQIGLREESIRFNNFLINQNFEECRKIISTNFYLDKTYWKRMKSRVNHIIERKKDHKITGKKSVIYIYWHGFWPNMNQDDCQLLDFLKEASKGHLLKSTNKPRKADIFISSCFGKEIISNKFDHCLKILFLGENIRPYFKNYDLSLTCDINDYRGRNINLPLWLLEIDLFDRNKNYDDRNIYNLDLFTNKKVIDFSKRKCGIVYVGNNEEPFRQTVINAMAKHIKNLQIYGSQTNPIEDKQELLKKFKGSIVFENSFYPGYITEKIIHTYLAGNISIYWGCQEDSFLKKNSLIHTITTKTDLKEIILLGQKIIRNNEKLEIQPLFEKNFILKKKSSIINKLNQILKQFKL